MFGKIREWGFWRMVGWCLDWVYPPRCVHCERGGEGAICGLCARELVVLREPFCAVCSEPFAGVMEGEFACPHCEHLRFDFLWARSLLRRNEVAMGVVHALKYERRRDVMEDLRVVFGEMAGDGRWRELCERGWVLVPVPLFGRKLRERYYNQAGEIARILGQEFGLRVEHCWVRRVRDTGTQTRLNRRQRQVNVKGAFALTGRGKAVLAGGSKRPAGVILVDDVFTTGATVDACAAAFRLGGMQNVVVVTLMRG